MKSVQPVPILIVAMMLSTGCLGFLEGEEPIPTPIDCEQNPTHVNCEPGGVTEDDCAFNQIFTGDACRFLLAPRNLYFGVDSLQLVVGIQMQSLTPSFEGDGPEISPLDWSSTNPDGNLGFTSQFSGPSPSKLGVSDCICIPTTN
jgi:hypothetical protein